jgi:hypothetical protein
MIFDRLALDKVRQRTGIHSAYRDFFRVGISGLAKLNSPPRQLKMRKAHDEPDDRIQ